MYEVKEYREEDSVMYGVYIRSTYSGYKIDNNLNDNLVVLCKSKVNAQIIALILRQDNN